MINKMTETMTKPVTVQGVRHLTDSTYVLRFDRNGRKFRAGQHVILGIKDENNAREYSVYSAEGDDFFEVLIKEVLEGDVSKRLKKLRPGSELQMDGPMGFFTMGQETIEAGKVMLIATGTGIAPFRSFVRSNPQLDYHVLHGVRYGNESYDQAEYDSARFTLCTSGDETGNFTGRVTDYLRSHEMDGATQYFLCGNVKMIHEAFDILKNKGVPEDHMHAEVYF